VLLISTVQTPQYGMPVGKCGPQTYRTLIFDVGSFGLNAIFLEEGSVWKYLGVTELKI
jgi:hypothetical protein